MMKQYLARLIFRHCKKQVHDLFLEDLLLEIPEKITKPALEFAAAQRSAISKWLYFEASHIFRRDPTDFGNLERRNGMLILIKALLLSIGGQPKAVEYHPVVGETIAPPDEWIETAIGGVAEFKKGPTKKEEESSETA